MSDELLDSVSFEGVGESFVGIAPGGTFGRIRDARRGALENEAADDRRRLQRQHEPDARAEGIAQDSSRSRIQVPKDQRQIVRLTFDRVAGRIHRRIRATVTEQIDYNRREAAAQDGKVRSPGRTAAGEAVD
jgi:hypothetical protein